MCFFNINVHLIKTADAGDLVLYIVYLMIAQRTVTIVRVLTFLHSILHHVRRKSTRLFTCGVIVSNA